MQKKKLSRRDFIRASGLAAGAGLIAACTPQEVAVVQTQLVEQTSVVTQVVRETELVSQIVTATPAPTAVPEPAVMDIWAITTVEDLNAEWAPDPNNEEFKKQWWTGGMIRAQANAFLAQHPGVTLKITGHSWDWDLRQNILLALAAGIVPDTHYGEAYVTEIMLLDIYSPVSAEAAALFPDSTYRAMQKDGNVYGLAETTGANVLFVNLDSVEKAGLDPAALPATWPELLTFAHAISDANSDPKWGNNAYFTYAPAAENFGIGLRMTHWWEQNNTPMGSDLGVPTLNMPGAADVWLFHNELLLTSEEDTILNIDALGEGGSAQALNDGLLALKAGWTNDATTVGNDPDANVVGIEYPIPVGGKKATVVIGNQINSPLKNGPNPELAIDYIEISTTNEEAQILKPNGCGIWIPALKSMLEQYATFDKLGGFATEKAKDIVRVTMKAVLDGGAGPTPGWPKNGGRIWNAWNESYGRIWHGNLDKAAIQTELDALQVIVEGLVKKSG